MAGSTSPNPTTRRRQIARRLRVLRENAEISREEIARYLGCQVSKVSKFENGKLALTAPELRLLAIRYELPDADADELIEAGLAARRRGWWTVYGNVVSEWVRDYVGLESDAVEIRSYESEALHGLLQTADYARAIISPWPSGSSIDRMVELRLARQERFEANNPEYTAIVNESTLRRTVGGADTMRRQLEHLIDLSGRPNITLQVLPFSVGAHPAMGTSFTILNMPAADSIVYLESLTAGLYLEKESDLTRYNVVFDDLRQRAATPDESRAILAQVADEVR